MIHSEGLTAEVVSRPVEGLLLGLRLIGVRLSLLEFLQWRAILQ